MRTFVENVLYQYLLYWSLRASSRQRKETQLKRRLQEIVPDVGRQYTSFTVKEEDRYLIEKIRSLHAFQVNLLLKAVSGIQKKAILIGDIGDSSGVHMAYAKKLLEYKEVTTETFSVNLDPVAIQKIKERGGEAFLCRAEELHEKYEKRADIFCMFEVLEHFFDPISFLKQMAERSTCQRLVISVPYMKRSRVGLQYIRYGIKGPRIAENTHIFELSPGDWDLLFKFAGWKIVNKEIFLQYPSRGLLTLVKLLWRRFDFEGFYGVVLEKDDTFSSQYKDWPK